MLKCSHLAILFYFFISSVMSNTTENSKNYNEYDINLQKTPKNRETNFKLWTSRVRNWWSYAWVVFLAAERDSVTQKDKSKGKYLRLKCNHVYAYICTVFISRKFLHSGVTHGNLEQTMPYLIFPQGPLTRRPRPVRVWK